jgi:hypothetical protein
MSAHRGPHRDFLSMGQTAEGCALHQGNLGWDGRDIPLVLFPATGPSHCVAPAYALHSAAGDRKGFHLCGDLAFGPSHLIRRSCIIYLRRFRLFAAVHPTYSASVLGAFVKVRNANSTRAAHRRALSVRMAFSRIAHRGWTSARLAGAPSGSALAALLPFVVVRSRQTADGRRERADSCH